MNAARERETSVRADAFATLPRPTAVIVTNSIPGHDAGFAKSGHAHYFGSFVNHLVDRGFEVVLIVLAPPLDRLIVPAGAFPYKVVSPDLRSIGDRLVVSRPRALLATMLWLTFARLPGRVQNVLARIRASVRRQRGFSHVLGSFISFAGRAYVATVVAEVSPDVIVYDGIFNAGGRFPDAEHWILTHEVKHERAAAFAKHGVPVLPRTFSVETEREILRESGNIIAIQWDDAGIFARLVPEARIVVVPVTITPAAASPRIAKDARCIFVGSGSFHNVDGITWFLQTCWPQIRRAVPAATLDIYGTVGYRLDDLPDGVATRGVVDDLTGAYAGATLAIVPLQIGSGLKVKLVEALAQGVPIVTTSVGAQGLLSFSPLPFLQADDPATFVAHCVRVLSSPLLADELSATARHCAQRFRPDAAFAELDAALQCSGRMPMKDTTFARICVAIPTFRRPELLESLLHALSKQTISADDARIEIVLLDNDPDGSARRIVEKVRRSYPFPLHYEHVVEAGLATVRNRALDFATGRFEYLGMIDDDEIPEPQWLEALLAVARRIGSEVVVGPVFPVLLDSAPAWLAAARARETPIHSNGALIREGWSCNALVSLEAVARMRLRFEPALNFAGGEDQLFFRQMHRAGAAIAFAADACVHEVLAAERLTVEFNLRRAFRRGNSLSFCERKLDGGLRTALLRATKATAVIFLGLLRIPRKLFGREASIVGEGLEIARGLGMLSGLFGSMYQAYGRKS